MKKKIFLTAVMTIVSCCMGFAQEVTKSVVNVGEFTYTSQFSSGDVAIVRNNVIQSLQATKRVIVVDLAQQAAVQQEAERRKSEAALNDTHEVKDITLLNANFVLTGLLKSITQTQKTLKDLKGQSYTLWCATVEYSINLIDPATGSTKCSFDYTSDGDSRNGADEARTEAINGSSGNMKKFIEEAFPVRGKILQMADGDEKKPRLSILTSVMIKAYKKGRSSSFMKW